MKTMQKLTQTVTKTLILGLFMVVAISLPSSANAQSVPDGFEVTPVVGGLFLPTHFEYAPDGRIFIIEKGGVVQLYKDGALLPTPFHTLTDVNTYGDRGLTGLALDPNFDTNGYVYLAYAYENDATNEGGPKTARVVRVTADGDTVLPGSELVIIGTEGGDITNPSCTDFPVGTDCIGSDSSSHSIDDISFGPDGYLYVSMGDGASFEFQDPLAHRSLNLDTLNGKVLRITTLGNGLASNPHYDGDITSNRSKV